jgi:ADP-heptose:LPS heptosyltransferase
MGDLIQSSPLLAGLKQSAPGVELTLLISDAFAETAARLPGVDRVVPLSLNETMEPLLATDISLMKSYRTLQGLAAELVRQPFDRIINITHSNYSAVLTALIAWRSAAADGGRLPEVTGLFIDREGFRSVNGNWANYYFNSVLNRAFNRFNLVDIHCRIGGVAPAGRLFFNITGNDRQRADDILKACQSPVSKLPGANIINNRRLVAVIPAASTREKQYPADMLSAALNILKQQVEVVPIIFGAPKETDLGVEIARQVSGAVNLCGRTDVGTLAALLERCSLCLTNDTGPMHVAAVAGTPVLDLTLGSALAWETAPYGAGHIVIEPRIGCFPCLPRYRCSHYSCHRFIKPELVASLAATMLNKSEFRLSDDDPEVAAVNIYRTGFDDEGWWELTPLVRRTLTQSDVLNSALREMWKISLDGAPAWKMDYTAQALRLGRKLAESFDVTGSKATGTVALRSAGVSPASYPDSGLHDKWLGELANLAANGLSATEKLMKLGDGSDNVPLASKLGAELRAIDQELVRLAYGRAELMPLVAQFTYGKDNLIGNRLDVLAGQTAVLYRNLTEWSRALPNWMNAIMSYELRVMSFESVIRNSKLTTHNPELVGGVRAK